MSAIFGGGSGRQSAKIQPADGLRVQRSIDGLPLPLGWGQFRLAGNLLDYQDFLATTHKSSATSGGKGLGAVFGKGTSGSTSYTYSAAVVIAVCQGPIDSFVQIWNSKSKQTLASLGLTGFLGTYAQTAWPYMSSAHSANALTYRGIAYAAAGPMQLGSSPELPNLNFEVKASINTGITGSPDADPADVVSDFLTNSKYGVGFPTANLASLTTYSNYCCATGMVVSPVITNQRAAADFLNELAAGTNSNFRWSGSTLSLVPYGDTTITAHGHTYTAPSAAQYDLVDADFISSDGPPVRLTRSRPSDQYNLVRVRYLNRDNDYNQQTVTAFDEAAIAQYGLRAEDPKDYPFFCLGDAAQQSASLRLGRQQVRNMFSFTVGRRFLRLDPLDIVSITDANLGLSSQWVRITDITENSDGTLSMQAEEYLNGTGAAPVYARQANSGHVPDYNPAPGNVNDPVIFFPPMAVTDGALEAWMVVSGADTTLWGGCQVWISTDDTTYKQVGTIDGPGRQGVTTASYAAHADPDDSNTLAVNLAMSGGALTSGTAADENNYNMLAYVGGELVSYRTATLTSTSHYDLTHVRRGAYGTPIATHNTGAQFARLDEGVFKLGFTEDRIGTTVYIKLLSFNVWGGGQQALGDVSAYSVVVGNNYLSFYDMLTDLNMTSGLKLCLDAGDARSYPGTGQSFYDRSSNAANFYLGDGSGSESTDPTFVGTAGDLLAGTYFSSDGGDYFTVASNDVPSWAQTFHKPGAAFTLAGMFYLSGANDDLPILSTCDTSADGIEFVAWTPAGPPFQFDMLVRGNSTLYGTSITNYSISAASWHFFAVSYDDTNQRVIFMLDGNIQNIALTGAIAAGNNSAGKLWIGHDKLLSKNMPASSRMEMMGVWNTVLSGTALSQIYHNVRSIRNGFALT